jgi:hypothetical protein
MRPRQTEALPPATTRLFLPTHYATLAFPVLVAFFMEPAMEHPIPPLDPLVADMVNLLDASQREEFEERAAIIEYDAKLPRGHAECLALLDVLRRYPSILVSRK